MKHNTLWTLNRGTSWVTRNLVYLNHLVNIVEWNLFVKNIAGVSERMGLELFADDQDRMLVLDKETELVSILIDVSKLGWSSNNESENTLIVEDLLKGESPFKLVTCMFMPEIDDYTELDLFLEDSIAYADNKNLISDIWLNDLRGTVEVVKKQRVRMIEYGLISPSLIQTDLSVLGDIYLKANFASHLISSIYNGEWSLPPINDIGNGNGREDPVIFPNFISREDVALTIPGSLRPAKIGFSTESLNSKSYYTALKITGLGVSHQDTGEKTLNSHRVLTGTLPLQIKEPGDSITIITTFFQPEDPGLGKKLFSVSEEGRILSKGEESENGDGKKKEVFIDDLQHNYEIGYQYGMELIKRGQDNLVRVSNSILIQSAEEERYEVLSRAIMHELKGNLIPFTPVKSRDLQLSALRSVVCLRSDDWENLTTPFPLVHVARSLTPPEAVRVSPGRLKVLVGQTLPFREPFFFYFPVNFALLGGQHTGKTSLFEILVIRLSCVLPKDSILWVYDGTDVNVERSLSADYGWSHIARVINAPYLNNNSLPKRIKDGVLYGEHYKSEGQLREDLQILMNNGPKMIVFSSLDEAHVNYNTELAFFRTYKKWMDQAIPGVLFVDEIGHLAKDSRAMELASRIKDSTKRNQWWGLAGQTLTVFENTSENPVRSTLQANIPMICLGPTSLLSMIASETNINVGAHMQRIVELEKIVTGMAIQGIPGRFVQTFWGAAIMKAFSVTVPDSTRDYIRRKPKEEEEMYGY